jgi:hypothetical protein
MLVPLKMSTVVERIWATRAAIARSFRSSWSALASRAASSASRRVVWRDVRLFEVLGQGSDRPGEVRHGSAERFRRGLADWAVDHVIRPSTSKLYDEPSAT